jgi:transposase
MQKRYKPEEWHQRDKDRFLRNFNTKNLPLSTIGKIYGVSTSTVKKWASILNSEKEKTDKGRASSPS